MKNPNQNRHLFYYLTSASYHVAPVLVFEQYEDARDYLAKNRYRGYVMNTCWGYQEDGYRAEVENTLDHIQHND
jgi:hypothetical protein